MKTAFTVSIMSVILALGILSAKKQNRIKREVYEKCKKEKFKPTHKEQLLNDVIETSKLSKADAG